MSPRFAGSSEVARAEPEPANGLGGERLRRIVNVLAEEMSDMTSNDQTGSAPREEEPNDTEAAEDPGYLTRTGEAAAEDGSVAPIIGGLPAVEGSAWDIGAPLDERGAGLADEQGSRPDQASHEDTPSS